MSRSKRDLTRLSGLLTVAAEAGQPMLPTTTLPIDSLTPGSSQPRREFDPARLSQLADSVRQKGILQPLLVRPVGESYEIVAGERRWRAAKLAGLTEVPVIIRTLDQHEARQLALIENLQREDLNAIDEVDAKLDLVALTLGLERQEARTRLMQLLRDDRGEETTLLQTLFEAFGETWQSFAKNKLRVLNWPPAVIDAVRSGLPFTLGAVIAAAPAEFHAQLLKLALQGVSREQLRQEIQRLTVLPQRPQALLVGRVLTSKKWLGNLTAKEETEVERWLAQMPDSIRRSLRP